MKPDLTIDIKSHNTISNSFDNIAKDLMTNWVFQIGARHYIFTEIEFYFFLDKIHEDNSTHEHHHGCGTWRAHSQGIDITFPAIKNSDGGILIRGIKRIDQSIREDEAKAINGPRRVLFELIRAIGTVQMKKIEFGLVHVPIHSLYQVYKTIRHGLSKSLLEEYRMKKYRYYQSIDSWNPRHIDKKNREELIENSCTIKTKQSKI